MFIGHKQVMDFSEEESLSKYLWSRDQPGISVRGSEQVFMDQRPANDFSVEEDLSM